VIFQIQRESITFLIYSLIARSYLSDIEECSWHYIIMRWLPTN